MKPIHPKLKALAVRHEAFDGAVVFYMLPFRNLQASQLEDDFAVLYPRFRYRHTRSGAVTTERPAEYEALAEKAEQQGMALDEMPLNPFVVESLWDVTQGNFVALEGRTLDVEFHCDDATPTDVRWFESYWLDSRDVDLSERWQMFRQMVAVTVTNAWVSALNAATKAYRQYAPPAATSEPIPAGDDEAADTPLSAGATTTTTGQSSGRRVKRSPKAATPSASG